MDRKILQTEYDEGTISKQSLGKLRRIVLNELIENILDSKKEHIKSWLDNKQSKLDRAKLADAMGLRTQTVNLRQSFKAEIEIAEKNLRKRNIILNDAKTTKEIGDENVLNFILFTKERLANKSYNWPVNNKNRLYQRKFWSLFLNQEMDEVKSTPRFFSDNLEVKQLLASIDVLIANKDVNFFCYESESALDEMQNTMTSASISKLRQQVKEVREQLFSEREERKKLEIENHKLKFELEQYKARDKAIQSSNIETLKIVGAH